MFCGDECVWTEGRREEGVGGRKEEVEQNGLEEVEEEEEGLLEREWLTCENELDGSLSSFCVCVCACVCVCVCVRARARARAQSLAVCGLTSY